MNQKLKDRLSAVVLVIIAAGIGVILIPEQVEDTQSIALSPRFFPYFGCALVGIGASFLFISSFDKASSEQETVAPKQNVRTWLRPSLSVLVIVLFISVFEKYGFILSVSAMMFLLFLINGVRRLATLIIIPMLVTLALYALFVVGLGMSV
ncbi:tripartite tricarboxylate transporter TctB family protein [Enterovibrio sp. ZSDZ42]|uniref:Tripartite tricarboxylate transporter TctB family protein n=1 Tax=Enterovibrio gelatinilyticus TaxID=2899819 RepID=A0ABT5QZK2_9GAMM|nr:tripartite tricarboxylate transporter TctB family protein [Enterovibrio sp. ZSDZ42]MDD1793438.1 tripartite tricarboxylate transporter TctB family protein [Enterovibrio sp. ZSDZ42]